MICYTIYVHVRSELFTSIFYNRLFAANGKINVRATAPWQQRQLALSADGTGWLIDFKSSGQNIVSTGGAGTWPLVNPSHLSVAPMLQPRPPPPSPNISSLSFKYMHKVQHPIQLLTSGTDENIKLHNHVSNNTIILPNRHPSLMLSLWPIVLIGPTIDQLLRPIALQNTRPKNDAWTSRPINWWHLGQDINTCESGLSPLAP